MSTQYTVIQGKQVPYSMARIPNDQLELDPGNPRVQYLVGQMAGNVTQARLDELIWAKDQVKALAQSIFQNGGIREAIIVQPIGKNKYRVREGNSRTVCNRHLSEQHPDDQRFAFVPAHVFEQNLTEEDIAVILADFHVAGKIRWDAYEQAKHIHDLFNVYGKTYDWLSDHLRMSKSKISEHLAAYKATTDFLQVHPAPANIKKFSLFQELMKKKDLRERYEESDEFRQQVYRWLEKDRISDAKQMRSLPGVLENAEATKALNTRGFDEAAKVLIQNDPSLGSDLFHAVKTATAALAAAPASDIQDLKSGNAQKLIMLRNLKRSLEDISTLAGITL
jgi:hypothetical protein